MTIADEPLISRAPVTARPYGVVRGPLDALRECGKRKSRGPSGHMSENFVG